MKYKNVFYFTNINKIGGVESFYWYLAQKYGEYDLTVFYKTGDDKQIARLKRYCRVEKFNGQRIQCEKAFFNYTQDIIDSVDADEYFYVVHGDYKVFKKLGVHVHVNPKITRFIGVSQLACDTFKDLTGQDVELVYNPIVPQNPQRALNLISATRLTAEKGAKRLKKLAEALDAHGINYTWQIFTDARPKDWSENVVFREPRLDILPFIASADYLVQLSDTEGYCFSVVEALCLGTPVIVTPCPVYKELGLNKTDSITLPFDMSEIPIPEIVKGKRKFKYEPPEDRWGELLAKGQSTYDPNAPITIRVKKTYYDLELGRIVQEGERIKVKPERAEVLIKKIGGAYGTEMGVGSDR